MVDGAASWTDHQRRFRLFTKWLVVLMVCAAPALITGCQRTSDISPEKAAQDACEHASGLPGLGGTTFNWTHHLSGDLHPSFTDEGTVDWGYLTSSMAEKSYRFICTGTVGGQPAARAATMTLTEIAPRPHHPQVELP